MKEKTQNWRLLSLLWIFVLLSYKHQELLEGEPELSELADDVICPVCLDLLHEPFQVEPCGHIFCEPCLRRLGQKNPMNCSCPLCRTKIGFCKHLAVRIWKIKKKATKLCQNPSFTLIIVLLSVLGLSFLRNAISERQIFLTKLLSLRFFTLSIFKVHVHI